MTEEPRLCRDCAYKSDRINTLTPDYCYILDAPCDLDSTCCEWRGSLREVSLDDPPPLKKWGETEDWP